MLTARSEAHPDGVRGPCADQYSSEPPNRKSIDGVSSAGRENVLSDSQSTKFATAFTASSSSGLRETHNNDRPQAGPALAGRPEALGNRRTGRGGPVQGRRDTRVQNTR